MELRKSLLSLILLLVFVLSACSGGTQDPGAMAEKDSSEAMIEETPAGEMMAEKPAGEMMGEKEEAQGMPAATQGIMEHEEELMAEETPQGEMPQAGMEDEMGMMESPVFFSTALTHPASGQTFSIADFKGQVILVETMAMWCPNCLRQQQEVKALHSMLGERNDFLSLGLDIDPNENAGDLKGYVERNGFDWLYAVAPTEVSNEIAQLLGNQFLNPSSTPMFVVDRRGEIHSLPFGIKTAAELKEILDPFLSEGM